MHRRSFLLSAAATTATAALAGCGALSGSGVDQEALSSARSKIQSNEQTFDNASSQFEAGNRPDFDPDTVETTASEADETLAELESQASGDQAEFIAALRAWTEFQRRRADVLDSVVQIQAQLEIVSNHLGGDQIAEARSAITDAESIFDGLRTAVDEMETAYENVDRDALAAEGMEVSHDDITQFIDDMRDWLDVVEILLAGMGPLLDGFVAYQEANGSYQDEQFADAASRFGEGQSHFETAESELQGLEDRSTEFPTIASGAGEMLCAAGAFGESSGLMQESANAADSGEFQRANDLADQAVQAAERCDFGADGGS